MTDYKAIHGKNILHVASDLDNAEAEGQIWFNTTSSDYKTIAKAAGTWATSNSLNTAKEKSFGIGIQTAALTISGEGTATVEQYDGTSWSEIADVNTGREHGAGCGTVTSGLFFGGQPPVTGKTESWN